MAPAAKREGRSRRTASRDSRGARNTPAAPVEVTPEQYRALLARESAGAGGRGRRGHGLAGEDLRVVPGLAGRADSDAILTLAEFLAATCYGPGGSASAESARPRRVPTRTEHEIQNAILEYLTWRHIVHARVNSGLALLRSGGAVQLAKKGTSDVWACHPLTGQLVTIEVKRPGEVPTPDQEEFMGEVEASHAIALVADSLEPVMALFEPCFQDS